MTKKAQAQCPRPFVKWVGGKAAIVDELKRFVPSGIQTYYEPFVGGGALFFALFRLGVGIKNVVLSDANERLVKCYRGIRSDVDGVIRRLRAYESGHCVDQYYKVRGINVDALHDVDVAAWFIYLNKTCFNGLYRVNSLNKINAPLGKKTVRVGVVCDEKNLRGCASALSNVELYVSDFSTVIGMVKANDFVYCDPPYAADSSGVEQYTRYTPGGFGSDDHLRLHGALTTAKAAGARFLLSSSDSREVRELYAGERIDEVMVARRINRNAKGRGKVVELLISGGG